MRTERSLGVAASIVGLIGALYAAYGALTYKPVATYRAEISACNPEASEWIDLVKFLQANSGDVVLLYLRVFHQLGDCDTDFIFREERSSSGEQVAFYSIGSSITDRLPAEAAQELYSNGLMNDNGMGLSFEIGDLQLNSQTIVLISDEGIYDVFSGPFQLQFGMADAASWFVMSPPIISDETDKRIRCAKKEWSYLLNVLMCPVI